MPLDKSGTKASVGRNIATEEAAGKKPKQAIAIAMDVARRNAFADGGKTSNYDAVMGKARALNSRMESDPDTAMAILKSIAPPNPMTEMSEFAAHARDPESVPPTAWEFARDTALPTIATGLAPAVGKFIKPVLAGAAGVGAGLTLGSGEAGSQGGTAMDRLLSDRAELMRQRAGAQAERDAQAKTGRGPKHQGAGDELQRIDQQLLEVGRMIAAEQKRADADAYSKSPEAERDRRLQSEADAAKKEKEDLNKTFREAHPGWNSALPYIGLASAIGLPWLSKVIGQGIRNTPLNRMNKTVSAADEAIGDANASKISDLTPRLAAYKKDLASGAIGPDPSTMGKIGGYAGSALAGGAASAETRMFPSQWDAAVLPDDNPLKDKARERSLNPWLYAEGAIPGAFTGTAMYAKAPAFPTVPRSQDMEGILRKYGTTPATASRALSKSGGEPLEPLKLLSPAAEGPSPAQSISSILRPTASPDGPKALTEKMEAGRRALTADQPLALEGPASPPPSPASPVPEVVILKPGKSGKTLHEKGKFSSEKTVLERYKPKDTNGSGTDEGMKDGGLVGGLVRRYADGGGVGGGGTGLLHSDVPGRTDHLPLNVKAESFVIPADIVSALGEGNTLAGSRVLDKMLGGRPQDPRAFASGGDVPILAAGGEYMVSPEDAARVGGGDARQGHRILEAMVKQVRAGAIKKLQSIPGPSRG